MPSGKDVLFRIFFSCKTLLELQIKKKSFLVVVYNMYIFYLRLNVFFLKNSLLEMFENIQTSLNKN